MCFATCEPNRCREKLEQRSHALPREKWTRMSNEYKVRKWWSNRRRHVRQTEMRFTNATQRYVRLTIGVKHTTCISIIYLLWNPRSNKYVKNSSYPRKLATKCLAYRVSKFRSRYVLNFRVPGLANLCVKSVHHTQFNCSEKCRVIIFGISDWVFWFTVGMYIQKWIRPFRLTRA